MKRRLFAVLFAVLFVLALTAPASAEEHNTCYEFKNALGLPDAVNCDYDEPVLPIP